MKIKDKKQFKENNNFLESEISFGDLSKMIWRRRKLSTFIASFIILTTSIFTIFLRIYRPIFEGSFSILISDPINSDKKQLTQENLLKDYFKDIALNSTSSDIPTLIAFLKSSYLLNPLEKKYDLNYGQLERMINIKNPSVDGVPAKGIIEIKLQTRNLTKGRKIIKDLSNVYLAAAIDQKQKKLNDGLEFLNKQTPLIKAKTIKYQDQLALFREKYSLLVPAEAGLVLKQQEVILEEKILELESKNSRLLKIKEEIINGNITALGFEERISPKNLDSGESGLLISDIDQALLKELLSIEDQLSKAKSKFTKESKIVKGLNSKLEKIKPLFIKNQLEAVDTTILLNNAILNSTLLQKAEVENKFLKKPNLIKKYNDIQQDLEISRNNLNGLIAARENFQLEMAQKTVPWTIISLPQMGEVAVEPSFVRNFILALFFGGSFGAFCGLLRDRLDDVFYNSDEIEESLKFPILAEIPYIAQLKKEYIISESLLINPEEKDIKKNKNFLKAFDDKTLYQEAFSRLFTSIRFLNKERNINCFSITSSETLEGKSLINILLCKTLSQMGQKVLLIDADLRNPSIDNWLGLNNLKGLSNILSDNKLDLNKAIQKVPNFENWEVITAGTKPSNSTRLISSIRFKDTIQNLKNSKKYDYIILDNPPILGIADTSILAESTDGVFLIVSLKNIKKRSVFESISLLNNISKSPLLGVIVNSNKGEDRFISKEFFSASFKKNIESNEAFYMDDKLKDSSQNGFFEYKKYIKYLKVFAKNFIAWLDR